MLKEFSRYFTLFLLVLRYGRLKHSSNDLAALRWQKLEKLEAFIPQKKYQAKLSVYNRNSMLMSNPIVKRIIGEASFVKRSIFTSGGHLHLAFHNISYIRIPKSASTSLSSIVLSANYPDLKDFELSSSEINFLADVNLLTKIKENTYEIFFTVIRNPFARIVSVYRDFFENKSHEAVFKDYLFGVLPNHLSFSQFIERISLIPDNLKEPHIKPQYLFLEYYKRKDQSVVILKIDKPGQVESFLSIYGLSMVSLNMSDQDYDYKTYYSKSTFAKVASIYKEDIESFHFQKEVNDLKNFLINNEHLSAD